MQSKYIVSFAAVCFITAMLSGCGGKSYDLAQVSGVVKYNGEPLEGLAVRFLPNSEEGTSGPDSIGITDANGKYTLVVSSLEDTKGAVIGKHRVLIEDRMAENSRDEPMDSRVDLKFNSAGSTPINVEVNGDKTIDFELADYDQ